MKNNKGRQLQSARMRRFDFSKQCGRQLFTSRFSGEAVIRELESKPENNPNR